MKRKIVIELELDIEGADIDQKAIDCMVNMAEDEYHKPAIISSLFDMARNLCWIRTERICEETMKHEMIQTSKNGQTANWHLKSEEIMQKAKIRVSGYEIRI